MRAREKRVCARCVMDTTDPDIQFDALGFCNHCTRFLERSPRQADPAALDPIVEQMKRAGSKAEYDCVVGISGGVDSCYAAYVAKSLGLRPLAVHLDNGWDSDIAVTNIKSVCDKLGIDYLSYVLDWAEFRDLQLAFLRASVPEIETPTDIAIPAALHKVAAQNGLRYIVSGGNFATEGILPKRWHYNAKDVRYLKAIHRQFGKKRLKTFPTFGWIAESYYKFLKRIRFVYVLNCVPYSRSEATEILKNQLGWREYGGKHYESRITRFVQSYVLPQKFDIDYRRATLSTQICFGTATREDALAALESKPFDPATIAVEKEYIAKKFEIAVDELNAILDLPPKSHRDYPNQERWLELFYRVYRRWHGE